MASAGLLPSKMRQWGLARAIWPRMVPCLPRPGSTRSGRWVAKGDPSSMPKRVAKLCCAMKSWRVGRSSTSKPLGMYIVRSLARASGRGGAEASGKAARRKGPLRPDQRATLPPRHQALLDLADRLGGVEVLGAGLGAVHDGVAAIEAERVLELVETVAGRLVAAVGDPAEGLQQDGRAEIALGVPPVARAGGRAAGAEDALVIAVEPAALLGRLR